MSEDEIEALAARLGSLAATLRDDDPADKSEIYRQLGLRPTRPDNGSGRPVTLADPGLLSSRMVTG
jgi:hypothetical protein